MSATIPIQVGGDLWNARVYASLSAASELAAELDVPDGACIPSIDAELAYNFLNRLNSFLAQDLSLTDSIRVAPTNISKEKLVAVRDSFLDLHHICDRILHISKELVWSDRIKSELEVLGIQSERLLDVVDWLDALSTPEETDAIFKNAAKEKANGDLVAWSQVQ